MSKQAMYAILSAIVCRTWSACGSNRSSASKVSKASPTTQEVRAATIMNYFGTGSASLRKPSMKSEDSDGSL
eukprot:2565971-Alexandrium_andersonii.AAC.1